MFKGLMLMFKSFTHF